MQRILIVDDEPDILDSLVPTLEQGLDAEVDVASSAEEAQQRILEAGPYDMVITDQRMPGLKGTDLLAWLRREEPEAVRVLMSAFYDSFVGPEAAEGDAQLYLRKPFRVETMLSALREALEEEAGEPPPATRR